MALTRPLRVLFVCLGNAYRSQMAAGFARCLGRDVLTAESAGLTPVDAVPEMAVRVMREKGIDITAQSSKGLDGLDLAGYDVVVNMSGLPVPGAPAGKTRVWQVFDPVWAGEQVAREVRDEIERRVMGLILELRQQRQSTGAPRRPKLRGV